MGTLSTTALVLYRATTGERHIERVSNTLAAVLYKAELAEPATESSEED